jgi:hypothetical protein
MTPHKLKQACNQQPPDKNLNESSPAGLILLQAMLLMVLCGQSSRVLSFLAGLSGVEAGRDGRAMRRGNTLILLSQN